MKKQIALLLILLPCLGYSQQLDTVARIRPIFQGKSVEAQKDSTLSVGYQLVPGINKNRQILKLSVSLYNALTQTGKSIFGVPSVSIDTLPRKNVGFQLSVDQDAFYNKKNEDRDYTMGLMASIIGYQRRSKIAWFTRELTTDERNASRFHFNFGFSGFTPENLGTSKVLPDDRPYAAIAYFSYAELFHYNERYYGNFKLSNSFTHTLLAGSMGSGISRTAKFIQTAIHSGQRSLAEDTSTVRPNPLGWEHAIGHGKKINPVFNYDVSFSPIHVEYTVSEHPFGIGFLLPFKVSFKPNVGLAVGTLYDNFSGGFDWQIGLFNQETQFGNPVTKDARGRVIIITKSRTLWGVSLIGDFYRQYWLHNSTINGILFSNYEEDHVIRHRDMKSWTSYHSIGIQANVGNFKLGYSVYHRSAVMNLNPRPQYYGRFFLKVDI